MTAIPQFLWQCVCGATEHPEPVPIFLHIARCESCLPGLRDFAREIVWENLRAPGEKVARFRQLMLELGMCPGRPDDGCWWCDNGRTPARHRGGGPYLLVAAVLVRLRVLPARIVQAAVSMAPPSNEVEKQETPEADR